MMKPGVGTYYRFKELFDRYSKEAGKEQYLIPYFIAAHPGTTDEDMLELALWLKKNGFRADQVQAFLPSPMATATAMYHSGKNPLRRVYARRAKTCIVPKGLQGAPPAQGVPALSRREQLADAARGAAAHGPRRPDRQRQAAPRAGVSAGGDGRGARRPARRAARIARSARSTPDCRRRRHGARARARRRAARAEPGRMRSTPLALLVVCIAGCATLVQDSLLDQRYGAPDPARYDTPRAPAPGGMSYRKDVQPILERRCVVCHGCYDAPCQIKLGAWEGIARGGSTATVYDGGRLSEAPTTRLFVDAQRPSEWRKKGFFPILNERAPTPEANLAASVLYRSLALKRAHPLPGEAVLPKPFDFSLDRSQSCPRIEQYDAYERDFPLAGMPYGLPGLDPREFETVARWLVAGAPYDGSGAAVRGREPPGARVGGVPQWRLARRSG